MKVLDIENKPTPLSPPDKETRANHQVNRPSEETVIHPALRITLLGAATAAAGLIYLYECVNLYDMIVKLAC